MSNIIPMGDLAVQSPELGNKVKNLAHLAKIGVRVPKGFGVCYNAYDNHVASLIPRLEAIRTSGLSYVSMANLMRKAMILQPLESGEEIITALGKNMPKAEFFAVRSSGAPVVHGKSLVEDSKESSLAGQYTSYLLLPRHNVLEAVLWCYASLFSERCLAQFDVKKDAQYLRSRMSVLVQEMCVAELCGVAMTRDPLEDNDNIFGVEITYGACEALVSGNVQGDMHLIDRRSGVIISSELGSKKTKISYAPLKSFEQSNQIYSVVTDVERNRFAASPELLARIFNLCMRIERQFGAPQDIEFVVVKGDIIVTQARPITRLARK